MARTSTPPRAGRRFAAVALSACSLCALPAARADAREAPAPVATRPGTSPVTVGQAEYAKWPAAYRLANGGCELVVVPQVTRAMSFRLPGGPNAFWNNAALAGRVFPKDDNTWHNFGGDKVWPTEQKLWAKYANRPGWPPPHAFDPAPAAAEVLPGDAGLRLTTVKSPDFGSQTVREFVPDPAGRPLVLVRQWHRKADGDPVPMSVWSVTQVPKPDYAMIPLGRPVGGQPFARMAGEKDPPFPPGAVTTHPTVVTIRNDARRAMKIGAGGDPAGRDVWAAAVTGAQMLVESRRYAAGTARFPDGCPAHLYAADAAAGSYVELELLSEMVDLKAGESLRDDMVWQLVTLTPEQAKDPERAAVEARKAHATALEVLGRER